MLVHGEHSSPARTVLWPGLCLLIVGGLHLCGTLATLAGMLLSDSFYRALLDSQATPLSTGGDPAIVLEVIVPLPLTGIVLFGAWRMLYGRARPWALAAAISAMIPCVGPCCGLGLPIGLWAFVVLGRPSVRQFFAENLLSPDDHP